jgi:hypothetical protein
MEVRWFIDVETPPGGIPPDVQRWFNGGGTGLPQGDRLIATDGRDDIYLSLPDSVDLGVKVRAGQRLEVKRRRVDAGVHKWRDGIAGRVEQWVKWSFVLTEQDEQGNRFEPPDVSMPPGHWIVVNKQRQLRKFAVGPGDRVEAIAASGWPAEGCQLEITRLGLGGRVWWSLGLEAFGRLERVEEILDLVMEHVLAYPGFPNLNAVQSCAYPAWLGVVLRHEGRKLG